MARGVVQPGVFWKAGMTDQVTDITEEAMRRQAGGMKSADKWTRAMLR